MDRETIDRPTTHEVPTKVRLIAAARRLFLSRGYEATGVAEILRAAGVNSGSLYYFFKTKEELLLAVLDWYTANLYPEVIDPVVARVVDPIERIFGVLKGYRQLLTSTGCTIGCPIGNLALEMSEKSEAVRQKIALNFENWRKAIRSFLIDAGDRLPREVDRDTLATFILTVMEGGVMQARAQRSLAPFEASVAILREYFDRLLMADASIGQDSQDACPT
jgi:AcrR family transcriptional regulator